MLFDVEIPKWARWLTQDSVGEWDCHSQRPRLALTGPYRGFWTGDGCHEMVAKTAIPADWTQELYEITVRDNVELMMLHPPPTKTEVDEAYNESARHLIHEAMQPGFQRWDRDRMHGRFLMILHTMEDYIQGMRSEDKARELRNARKTA